MSGQTVRWRRVYSSSRPGFTWSWKHTRCRPSSPSTAVDPSEVELVDVAGVELERVAEEDGVVGAHGVVTELAGLELVALLALDVALDQGVGGVRREVAEVLG